MSFAISSISTTDRIEHQLDAFDAKHPLSNPQRDWAIDASRSIFLRVLCPAARKNEPADPDAMREAAFFRLKPATPPYQSQSLANTEIHEGIQPDSSPRSTQGPPCQNSCRHPIPRTRFSKSAHKDEYLTEKMHMTFLLEPIGQKGLEKIQRDLQSQDKYKDLQVANFLSSGANQRWAIDSKRNRYLHSIRRIGTSYLRPYHFFPDGISYEIEIPDSICRAQYSAHIDAGNDANDHASILKVLPAIQEAFDTFGSCGFGPDEEGWPGFYRVELTLAAQT